MSVLIQGMDMPHGCRDCPFLSGPWVQLRDVGKPQYRCRLDTEETERFVTDEVVALSAPHVADSIKTFPQWCPLVPVQGEEPIMGKIRVFKGEHTYTMCRRCNSLICDRGEDGDPYPDRYCPRCGEKLGTDKDAELIIDYNTLQGRGGNDR